MVMVQFEASVEGAKSVQGSVAGTGSCRGRGKDEDGWNIYYADPLGIFSFGREVVPRGFCGVQVGPGPQFR